MPTPETGHWMGTVTVGMGGFIPCSWQVNKGWGLLWLCGQGECGEGGCGLRS